MVLYFCHKCNQRCDVSGVDSGDVKCTRCNDSFVEEIQEMEAESPPVSIPVDDNPFMMFPASPFSQLFQMLRQQQGQNVQSSSNATPGSRGRGGYSRGGRGQPHSPAPGTSQPSSGSQAVQEGGDAEQQDPMANLIQHIFSNLVAGTGAGGNAGSEGDGQPNQFIFRIVAGDGPDQPEGAFRIHSNIRDYAWGPNGLDNILTALLNQFTEAEERARALSQDDIERLPKYKVSQKHVDNETQCTTCMETFKLGEDVVKLDCDHIFHFPCIEPWLHRNNSCPICRTEIDPSKWRPKITDVDELD